MIHYKSPPDSLFASLTQNTSKPLNTQGFYRGGSAFPLLIGKKVSIVAFYDQIAPDQRTLYWILIERVHKWFYKKNMGLCLWMFLVIGCSDPNCNCLFIYSFLGAQRSISPRGLRWWNRESRNWNSVNSWKNLRATKLPKLNWPFPWTEWPSKNPRPRECYIRYRQPCHMVLLW